jgi:predicted lipoprotein with Yx(FWY)xxD motif
MTRSTTFCAVLAAVAVGCGGDSETASSNTGGGHAPVTAPATAAAGTRIVARSSRFGRMLFNSKRQAIYIFELDKRRRSNCHDDCAELWPPVYTKGKPRAGSGVRSALLGTIKRRGGRLQVTYSGKPRYYYAHEGPGEVLCHNVHLNGGLWWVVGPNGKRRP